MAEQSTHSKKAKGLAVATRLKGAIPESHIKSDALYTYAYSTDASYFRLVPALVVIANSEDEVRAIMAAAQAEGLPVTFRAAGTSLSGQAVTDGVLCVLGDGWRKIEILDEGAHVNLGPAIIVANANKALKPYDRRIGPDPASQATAKIGGVVSNNSSGMCCGVIQNTYHTMTRLRLILKDGTLLDSGDPVSRDAFRLKRPDIIAALEKLAANVRADNELVDLIRRKYEIKNTVGYSLNALIDFTDPIDILTHLIVGSEGTLAFVSEVTYRTVEDHPHKATAIVPFVDADTTARGVQALAAVGVSAAEFIERRALATVEDRPAMQDLLPHLTDTSPAVLVEIMADSAEALDRDIQTAITAMTKLGPLCAIEFTKDVDRQAELWEIRKGLFANAGADRRKGTAMLTEDVAVPIHRLAEAVGDLRELLDAHGYDDAIIFGHALAGNLHFQMAADFANPAERKQFDTFCAALAQMVSVDYQGSLKAEHGTGRAVAPFVELEWGKRAYTIMEQIKQIFDPEGDLNPGVILNEDDKIHVKNTKAMVPTNDLIDMCIECGFCEPACPSAGLTLSPRQRIAVSREQARLEQSGGGNDLLEALNQGFVHAGMDTCAACNLCATRCPVGIETGTLIMERRTENRSDVAKGVVDLAVGHTGAIETAMRGAVGAQSLARSIVGDGIVDSLSGALNVFSNHKIPKPNRSLRPGPGVPKIRPVSKTNPATAPAPRGKIVYFPACASRMFGAAKTDLALLPVTEAMLTLITRAGYEPVLPDNLHGACCGQPFQSKGFPNEAKKLGYDLQSSLTRAQKGDDLPLVTDMSTCALHVQKDGTEIMDSGQFLHLYILPHLTITQALPSLAVHHNCSAQRMDEQSITEALAAACATQIAPLDSVTCCGYAGDKGMYQPELNAHALRFAQNDIPENCTIGVSTVSTCATGLSDHLGIPFVAVASLLEYVSRPPAH